MSRDKIERQIEKRIQEAIKKGLPIKFLKIWEHLTYSKDIATAAREFGKGTITSFSFEETRESNSPKKWSLSGSNGLHFTVLETRCLKSIEYAQLLELAITDTVFALKIFPDFDTLMSSSRVYDYKTQLGVGIHIQIEGYIPGNWEADLNYLYDSSINAQRENAKAAEATNAKQVEEELVAKRKKFGV